MFAKTLRRGLTARVDLYCATAANPSSLTTQEQAIAEKGPMEISLNRNAATAEKFRHYDMKNVNAERVPAHLEASSEAFLHAMALHTCSGRRRRCKRFVVSV